MADEATMTLNKKALEVCHVETDPKEAKRLLREWLDGEPALRSALLESAYHNLIEDVVGEARSALKQIVLKEPNKNSRMSEAAAEVTSRTHDLFSERYTFSSGVVLAVASHEEMLAEGAHCGSEKVGWGWREEFVLTLAKRTKPGEHFSDRWTDAEAERLCRRIRKNYGK